MDKTKLSKKKLPSTSANNNVNVNNNNEPSSSSTNTSQKSKGASDFASFDWKINPLDNLTSTGSNFLLRSPKFTCGEKIGKASDWYISLKYSPESPHLHADITLIKFHNPALREVYGQITLYVMRSSKLVSFKLGTVKRTFTTDSTEIFRHSTCTSCGLTTLQFKTIDLKMLQSLMVENKLIVRAELELFWQDPSIINVSKKGSGAGSKASLKASSKASLSKSKKQVQKVKSAWESHPQSSNCTLRCGNSYYPIHTKKLAASSPIFASIFDSFKNLTDDYHESKATTLTIKNIDASTMEIILKYIYEGQFELKIWNGEVSNPLDVVQKLLIASEAYQLFTLRDLCLMEMCNNLTLGNCGEIAVFARTLELQPIFKKRINVFIRKNWSLLQKDKKFLATFNKHPQTFEFIFSSKFH